MNRKRIYITGGSSGIGLAQALSQELAGTGVSVHVVCPPEIDTPMIAAESANAVAQTRFLKDLVGTLKPEVAAAKIAGGLRRGSALIIPGVRASMVAWIAQQPGMTAGQSKENSPPIWSKG